MNILDKLWAEYSAIVDKDQCIGWNVAVGPFAMPNVMGAHHCIAIGQFAGARWSGESYQIDVTDWDLARLLLDIGCEATSGMKHEDVDPWMHMTFVIQVGTNIWNGMRVDCPGCGKFDAMVDRGNGPRCWTGCRPPKLKLVTGDDSC